METKYFELDRTLETHEELLGNYTILIDEVEALRAGGMTLREAAMMYSAMDTESWTWEYVQLLNSTRERLNQAGVRTAWN